jgi:hypothetical protein
MIGGGGGGEGRETVTAAVGLLHSCVRVFAMYHFITSDNTRICQCLLPFACRAKC